jgi:hypothetical protein
MKKKKDQDVEGVRNTLRWIIRERYNKPFSQRLGNFFENLLAFIIILGFIALVGLIVLMLIDNPLSLLVLFVGTALLILIRRKG